MGQDNHTTGRKGWKHLSEKERYKIEALLNAGCKAGEIARMLGRHRRTIEREINRGTFMKRRENPYASRNPAVKDFLDEAVYAADVGQRKAEENAANKGRGLKIGHDHKLARYLEKRIGKDKFSPDAAIGEIKAKGLIFKVTLCTKTVYNMIDRGFSESYKQGSAVKKRQKTQIRNVANSAEQPQGRSIEERPAVVNNREELGHGWIWLWVQSLPVSDDRACQPQELICKLPDKRQQSVKDALDRQKTQKPIQQPVQELHDGQRGNLRLQKSGSVLSRRGGPNCIISPLQRLGEGGNENANKLIAASFQRGRYGKRPRHRGELRMDEQLPKDVHYKTAVYLSGSSVTGKNMVSIKLIYPKK